MRYLIGAMKTWSDLQRVADLATNIGEDAVYLAEGKSIKHHRELQPGAPSP